MPGKERRIWADPNIEGRNRGPKGDRYCAKCGNTVKQARILKSINLCEFCVKELEKKRDGISSCRGCGKVAPKEVQEHHGYCLECICPACGKPDPSNVRISGFCRNCLTQLGEFCKTCGKEAAAQVRKNRGYCDACKEANQQVTSNKKIRKPMLTKEGTPKQPHGTKVFEGVNSRKSSITRSSSIKPKQTGNPKLSKGRSQRSNQNPFKGKA